MEEKRSFLLLVALLQVLGACIGFIRIIISGNFSVENGPFIGLLIISLLGAFLLVRNEKEGVYVSILNYFFQLIDIGHPEGIEYKYNLFPYLNAKLDFVSSEFIAHFGLDTDFLLLAYQESNSYFAVNVTALCILFFLIVPRSSWFMPRDPDDWGGEGE